MEQEAAGYAGEGYSTNNASANEEFSKNQELQKGSVRFDQWNVAGEGHATFDKEQRQLAYMNKNFSKEILSERLSERFPKKQIRLNQQIWDEIPTNEKSTSKAENDPFDIAINGQFKHLDSTENERRDEESEGERNPSYVSISRNNRREQQPAHDRNGSIRAESFALKSKLSWAEFEAERGQFDAEREFALGRTSSLQRDVTKDTYAHQSQAKTELMSSAYRKRIANVHLKRQYQGVPQSRARLVAGMGTSSPN